MAPLYPQDDASTNITKIEKLANIDRRGGDVFYVSLEEAKIESNIQRGLSKPGWWWYREITKDNGEKIIRRELIKGYVRSAGIKTTTETDNDDRYVADSYHRIGLNVPDPTGGTDYFGPFWYDLKTFTISPVSSGDVFEKSVFTTLRDAANTQLTEIADNDGTLAINSDKIKWIIRQEREAFNRKTKTGKNKWKLISGTDTEEIDNANGPAGLGKYDFSYDLVTNKFDIGKYDYKLRYVVSNNVGSEPATSREINVNSYQRTVEFDVPEEVKLYVGDDTVFEGSFRYRVLPYVSKVKESLQNGDAGDYSRVVDIYDASDDTKLTAYTDAQIHMRSDEYVSNDMTNISSPFAGILSSSIDSIYVQATVSNNDSSEDRFNEVWKSDPIKITHVPKGTDARLKSISITGASFTFDPDKYSYDIVLPSGSLAITAFLAFDARYSGIVVNTNDSIPYTSTIDSTSKKETVTITVTAHDETTTATYTFNFSYV